MAGGVLQSAKADQGQSQAQTAEEKAAASQDAVNQQILNAYQAQAQQQAAPVPSYYKPAAVGTAQSPYLRVPGFQGVANPFFTPSAQPPSQAQSGQQQAASLLSQYNTYKQANADALYKAKAAQLAQAQAMQKAYQDKMAADKAAAEAAAARERQASIFSPFGGVFNAAEGGLAQLMKGRK